MHFPEGLEILLCQKLDVILGNKEAEIEVVKKCASKMIIFNEKKLERFESFFDFENQNFAIFDFLYSIARMT